MSSSAASPLWPLFTYAVETAMRWGRLSASPFLVARSLVARSLVARSRASSFNVSATRVGPSRFTSTAPSRGASKVTDAAAWMTMSQEPSNARPASSSASPSFATSPAIVWRRPAITSSKRSPSSPRSRSKQSLRRTSRRVRSAGPWCWPGRTTTTTSHSGTLRSNRSTSAVPRKPVAPVTAIRRPASSSGITGVFLAPGCRRAGTSAAETVW